jgi:hypothetical protein
MANALVCLLAPSAGAGTHGVLPIASGSQRSAPSCHN